MVAAFAGEPALRAVAEELAARVAAGGRRAFGSDALKVGGRIFAMLSSAGDFVVKLPRARVDALVAAGHGTRFTGGGGRVMKEWLVVTRAPREWPALAREAHDFVAR